MREQLLLGFVDLETREESPSEPAAPVCDQSQNRAATVVDCYWSNETEITHCQSRKRQYASPSPSRVSSFRHGVLEAARVLRYLLGELVMIATSFHRCTSEWLWEAEVIIQRTKVWLTLILQTVITELRSWMPPKYYWVTLLLQLMLNT